MRQTLHLPNPGAPPAVLIWGLVGLCPINLLYSNSLCADLIVER